MGRAIALFATLPSSTEFHTSEPLLSSSEWCSTGDARGRRWWVIDIDARAQFVDTTDPAYRTPTTLEAYPARAPLHLRLKYTMLTPSESFKRSRVIDAIPGRYLVFASTVDVELVTPSEDTLLFPLGSSIPVPSRVRSTSTLIAAVAGGIAPAGDDLGLAPTCGGSMDASFTYRLALPVVGPVSAQVPIPAAARTLQIFDDSGTAWRFASPRVGLLPTTGGASARFDVPTSLYVEPTDVATRRNDTTACVFGVHL